MMPCTVEDEVAAIADKTEDNPNPEATTEDKEIDSVKPGNCWATELNCTSV